MNSKDIIMPLVSKFFVSRQEFSVQSTHDEEDEEIKVADAQQVPTAAYEHGLGIDTLNERQRLTMEKFKTVSSPSEEHSFLSEVRDNFCSAQPT